MKAVMFTFDSLFALMIVVAIVPLILLFPSNPEKNTQSLTFEAESAVDVFSKLTVRNVINEPVIADLYRQNKITSSDVDRPVVDVIAQFWSSNDSANVTIARNMTERIIGTILPNNTKWSLAFDGDTLYDTGGQIVKTSVTGRRVASGYLKGSQSAGYIASIFLTSIGGKKASSYYFFGGFVGQGNMTLKIDDIPPEANVSDVYLEADVGENFALGVNGYSCGSLSSGVKNWTIASCVLSFRPGAVNNVTINFTVGNLSNEYIGGGYLRVTYSTQNMLELSNTTRYRFPGIKGIINLYDSLYVPGNITGMNATIRFYSPANYTTVLNIANVSVIVDNGTGADKTITISNSSFASMFAAKGISFSDLSQKTIPLRMYVGANITNSGSMNGTADIVLITDVSGSMAWRLDQDGIIGNSITNCNDPNIYSPSTSRISLARCLDKTFVSALLGGNSSCQTTGNAGNRIALVSFSSGVSNYENLTNNITYLSSRIDAYSTLVSTCISCAINKAYEILSTQSTPGRARYVIVMTDGVANIRSTPVCYDFNDIGENLAVGSSSQAYRSPPWIGASISPTLNHVDVNGTVIRAVGNSGGVYNWNGLNWVLEQTTGSDNLYGVDIYNTTFGFAAGASAKIWVWNGSLWTQSIDAGNFNFRAVNIYNQSLAFAAGDGGVIYKWNGTTWALYQDVGSANLYSLAVWNSTLAFVGGTSGKIYSFNGTAWNEMIDTGGNTHNDIIFVNSSRALTASSDGRIYEWNGGGWSGTQVSNYSLRGIHATGAAAYATGDGRGDIYEFNGAWSRTRSSFYYQGTSSTGIDCGDDDTCTLTVDQSYSTLNANYSVARAKQNINNLTVDSIGFGPVGTCTLGNQTIEEIARTGNGTAYSSSDATQLQNIYCQIADKIVVKSTSTQQVISEGVLQPSTLYDSAIDFNYLSPPAGSYQEISISSETPRISGCTADFIVPANINIVDAFRTSYSSYYWTKSAKIQNSFGTSVVYNLTSFGTNYPALGDPFRIYLPVTNLLPGENNITDELGLNASSSIASCSGYDRIIYNARLRASAPYGAVFPEMSGGVVRVYFDSDHDGTADGYDDISVGAELPGFNPSVRTVEQLDPANNAIDDALVRLLDSLNLVPGTGLPGTQTNPIDVMLGEVNIDTTGTGGIPFAWGPIDVRLEVKI